jgi:hypothetical protein
MHDKNPLGPRSNRRFDFTWIDVQRVWSNVNEHWKEPRNTAAFAVDVKV